MAKPTLEPRFSDPCSCVLYLTVSIREGYHIECCEEKGQMMYDIEAQGGPPAGLGDIPETLIRLWALSSWKALTVTS